MEQIVILLLALGAVYLVVKLMVEGCTSIDHAITERRQRRENRG